MCKLALVLYINLYKHKQHKQKIVPPLFWLIVVLFAVYYAAQRDIIGAVENVSKGERTFSSIPVAAAVMLPAFFRMKCGE